MVCPRPYYVAAGVNHPFELPDKVELTIDTSEHDAVAATDLVVGYLAQQRLVKNVSAAARRSLIGLLRTWVPH